MQVKDVDMFYLEDEDLARQLVELNYRGSGDTLKRLASPFAFLAFRRSALHRELLSLGMKGGVLRQTEAAGASELDQEESAEETGFQRRRSQRKAFPSGGCKLCRNTTTLQSAHSTLAAPHRHLQVARSSYGTES
eukprot:scaffold4101_cov267-Pinguiococcus_pyrenoidosus.AAC.8